MKHVSELFKNDQLRDKPWIIIGKGPSFSKINELNLNDYYTFGLNHVVTKLDALDIVHLIDFDVFESCQEDIYKKAKYLCLPINPHFNNKATDVTLKDLLLRNEILKKLSDEGRLFWYNHLKKDRFLTDNNRERLKYEDVQVKYFSAEAPFYILGMFGIKEIYSVGIDGGSSYDSSFQTNTLLANGRPSFDIQFDEITNTIEKFDLTYSPIDAQYPVKVYVGSQEEQMLSVKVLEYSIKKRTKVPVEVFPMHRSDIQYGVPKDPDNRQRTPFSFQRFTIPQLNNFKGRAIYVDSDMQVLKDIRQLWNLPMMQNDVLTVKKKDDADRVLQFSVMLLDCDKLPWSANDIVAMLDSGELNYHSLMREMKVAKNIGVKIPHTWNCLEWHKEGESALVHYTDMNTQPWVSTKNPLCKVWMEDLIEAIDTGFIDIAMVKDHVEKSWVRPSLLYQIENRIFDSLKLPKAALQLDKDFIAPYKKLEHVVKRELDAKNKSEKKSDATSPSELTNRILKSKSYKFFFRLIPPLKHKLKEINSIAAEMAVKLKQGKDQILAQIDDEKKEAAINEILLMKKSLSQKIAQLENKFFTKFFPSIIRKLKKAESLADIAIKDLQRIALGKVRIKSNVNFDGHASNRLESGYVEKLSDEQLQELNKILPWQCFTADLKGRRFGDCAWNGKRDKSQVMPDPRIVLMDQKFGLKNKTVLEIGCFEAIHTIALCKAGALVDAVDVRIENVVKTIVRAAMFGCKPNVYCLDVEKEMGDKSFDFVHHVGVLYHLKDPVSHLTQLAKVTKQGIMLDTHYCDSNKPANATYNVDGVDYSYYHYPEKGYADAFSGAYDHAKWLTLEDIKKILTSCGFNKIEVEQDRQERNGSRCLIFAYKSKS